ncbi:MAG: EAL domain-containing protein [Chloroflexaceae bacterium]|nr:EAL domain-containing protein [Chloroflexaceae bacterium]
MAAVPSPPQSVRHLLIVEDPRLRQTIRLEAELYTIGRQTDNHIVLSSSKVSRYHATLVQTFNLERQEYGYRLVDGDLQGNRSSNGVFVNGKRCHNWNLKHGDSIRFGTDVKATYQIVTEATRINYARREPLEPAPSQNKLSLSDEALHQTLTILETDWQRLKKVTPEREKERTLSRLASFPELNPSPIVEIDWQGNITYVNPAAAQRFSDLDALKLQHPILLGLLERVEENQGRLYLREVEIERGVYAQYVHYLPEHQLIRSYLFDFTERKQIESALRKSEARYRSVIQRASEGIVLAAADSKRVVEANEAYCQLLGYGPAAILSATLYDLVGDREQLEHQLDQLLRDGQDWTGECQHRHQDGTLVDVEVSLSLIYDGEETFLCWVVRDIRDRKQAEEQLLYRAFHDLLTGLPNRNFFQEQLATALANAKRYQHPLAVMFLDLDRFKDINDSLGHAAGDQLLQGFAQRLQTTLRAGDTVARWGGDEFVILLSRIGSAEDAAQVAVRILDRLQDPFAIAKQSLPVRTSIGIALYPQDGEEAETLLKHADAALYRIKEAGRSNYGFYSPKLTSRVFASLRLENYLYQALTLEQFELYYQPQMNIKTGRVQCLEALLRWQHPDLGPVSPSEFIPVAEATGLIVSMGEWALRAACRQNRAWQMAGLPPVRVAVNVSFPQFQQEDLSQQVGEILRQTELKPQWLEIEVAEATIMKNPTLIQEQLQRFQSLGVRVSIDDFGVGYSALSYLQHFPCQTLKIDQSFMESLKDRPSDSAMVSAIVALGRGFNLRVVAEGVETQQQLELLSHLQCEDVQGYWFSQPLAGEDARQFLLLYGGEPSAEESELSFPS